MTLKDFQTLLPKATITGVDLNWEGKICLDSREVESGDLFVAMRGQKHDGHDHIPQVIQKKAAVIVAQRSPSLEEEGFGVWLHVSDSREALAILANHYHGYPSKDLITFGVTGTNGKTTSTYLLHHLLKEWKHRAGLLGTVVVDEGMGAQPATHTTPDALSLQSHLAEMRNNGCSAVALEVSSHGLEQKRVAGVAFDVAVFTNLTQDHLDYHGSMESYFSSKKILFEQIASQTNGKKPVAVINLDDRYGKILRNEFDKRVKVITYGFSALADFRVLSLNQNSRGTEIELAARGKEYLVRSPLIGRFNVYNVISALAAIDAAGLPFRDAIKNLETLPQIPGRMEMVGVINGATVFVDYAHTPDALANACRALRELNPERLITVFGCGGDRDAEKRPLMGQAADEHSDLVFVTSDNPRSEDPKQIMKEIIGGMARSKKHHAIADRSGAIRAALMQAKEGDVVVVAGKGHENYQEVQGRRITFDDHIEIRNAINDIIVIQKRLES